MIKKNAVQKAKEIRVPARFSISHDQVAEVVNHYESGFECGLMFFRLGYMQGQRAAKAEQCKKEAAVCRKQI